MVLGVTMFVQHPVLLLISLCSAFLYAARLYGKRYVLRVHVLRTVPGLLFVALLNPLFNHYGVTTLAYLPKSGNRITLEALVYGLVLGSVLFISIEWFSCYNLCMTTDKFIYLFGRILPAFSLILSMALRFVPRFSTQLGVISQGQKCQGHDVKGGNLLRRIRSGLAILSILVTWALENAIDTADSMKSRGYGLPGRTAFSTFRFTRRDRRVLGGLGLLSLLFLWSFAMGGAYAQYNPRILFAGMQQSELMGVRSCSIGISFCGYLAYFLFCNLPVLLGCYQDYSLKLARSHVSYSVERTYQSIYESYESLD